MVKLKNLKKSELTAECDILPEDSNISGHIVIDLVSGKVSDFMLPEGYEWCKNHVYHASRKLLQLAQGENFPDEYLVVWY